MTSSSGSMFRAPGREHLDRRVERVRQMAPEKRSAGAPAAVPLHQVKPVESCNRPLCLSLPAEEAAFLEVAQLIAEVQALLPMVRDAARPTAWIPASAVGDRVAARRHHLLAFAKSARADCIGPQLSPYRHEAEYAIKVISTAGWCGYV